ncbi:MAG: hypothetical protein Q9M23_08870, partial [Mariprofundaceae bacterium]|nr:hypothetical protein [Mariprofundaceae bacterium]
MLSVSLLLLSACGPKTAVESGVGKASTARVAAAKQTKAPTSPAVMAMMRLAFDEGKVDEALAGLDRLIEIGRPPDLEEALFRRIQILLYLNDERAVPQANALLYSYPDYPMVPYLHLWLAQRAESQQLDDSVLRHALAGLQHPDLSDELRPKLAALGVAASRRSPDWQAVQWLFTASND